MFAIAVISLILWLIILTLPWRPWAVVERLERQSLDVVKKRQVDFSNLIVLIPARNEVQVIDQTLRSLAEQGKNLSIILIDDQSTDGTAELAKSLELENLQIIQGRELADGWSGKLWSLEQGFQHIQANNQNKDDQLILLLDADIMLQPGTLSSLLDKMQTEELDFVSLMARLQMENFWESLLMPAFIYFFKLLYPFKLSNQGHPFVAAAAGGCILLKAEALKEIGGFSVLRSALIDDCSLAKQFRRQRKSTWIGLSHAAISLRSYTKLSEIWNMVSRTAYTQLRCSPLLLLLCSFLMTVAFIVPLLSLLYFPLIGLIALFLMLLTYKPVVSYYNLPPYWVLGLPFAGILYLLMTWTSAFRYYRGRRSEWKGRSYT